MSLTFLARYRCTVCGAYATTTAEPPAHRRWVGTSLRWCGPYRKIPPTVIRVRV